jgi:hypothetical protein
MYWFAMFVNNLRINYLSTYLRPPLLSLLLVPNVSVWSPQNLTCVKKRQQSYNRKKKLPYFYIFLDINLSTSNVSGNVVLPFWCVFYVRQAIKTAARDLVLHGIVSQSNRPSMINGKLRKVSDWKPYAYITVKFASASTPCTYAWTLKRTV